MGLFGGGNSSSSTNTTTQSTGFSQIQGNASAVQGSNNTVSFVDPGALQAAQTIAGEALDQVNLAQQNSSNTAAAAIQAVASSAQGQTQSIVLEAVKWGALVALGFFALKAFGKG
jgi:hypothetical protein